ncbi:GNAT family N-acetyltransferase [Paenibacillus ginsengarvi]|uniref:GNAT family N-acetyltransferase n=1 Tax=Paenibacillus ginsengarvi TaxID=400777 RepID=A0A3B0CL34_9BACL|nr:GNAT family N-acetyltransferase [Paenibacillus ginsengarvi]RKN85067.1 GNAT family N-acetyltransferase [Paenibacillus ginsengarvi]
MLTFQKATTPEQIAVVAGLAHTIWNEHFISIIDQGQIDYMLEKFQSAEAMTKQLADGYEYYLFMENGRPVGYFGVQPQADGTLYLSKLYLLKDQRGKGYARQAFEEIKTIANRHNLKQIWLTVNIHNTDTIAVYKRFGMRLLRTQVADIGNGYVMDDEVYGYDL